MKSAELANTCYTHFLSRRHGAPRPIIVIPTSGRPDVLCEKTLKVLRTQGVPMKMVHLFIPNTHYEGDSIVSMKQAYRAAMRKRSIRGVRIFHGGNDLLKQYNCITAHYKEGRYLLIMGDNIDRIVIRKSEIKEAFEDLPQKHLMAITAHAFHMMKEVKCCTWSLAPCKAARNLRPGVISKSFGLIDGNCYGVLNRRDMLLDNSPFTCDLEWSCRSWNTDGVFFRYLNTTVLKRYRSKGGHQDLHSHAERKRLTTDAIKNLSDRFAYLIKYDPTRESSRTGQPYKLSHQGGRPAVVKDLIRNQGRPRTYFATRTSTSAERMRRLRTK